MSDDPGARPLRYCFFGFNTFGGVASFLCAPGSSAASDLGDECQPFIPGAAIFGVLFLFIIAMIIVHAPSLQICCACACCDLCRGKLPREALARNWLSWRLFNFAAFLLFCWNGALALLAPEIDAATGGSGTGAEYFVTALTGLFIALGMRPAARRRFHGLLGGLALKGEARSAAAVAALVGGRDPAAALKHGADSFRGLPYASLGEADFATSGDTGLNQKTKPVTLGSVDAFLSHSWHDSAADKWKALSSWATSRKDAPSTLLWLDKACINQSDIDASLAALPVYLSGCKELLVLVGPSYCSRLWCGPPLPPHHAPALPPHTYPGGYALTLLSRPKVRGGVIRLLADGRLARQGDRQIARHRRRQPAAGALEVQRRQRALLP